MNKGLWPENVSNLFLLSFDAIDRLRLDHVAPECRRGLDRNIAL